MHNTPYPLISIALCAFNGERHLREQLESLQAQDWPSIEIIAVDDASSDASAAILDSYARADARIRVLRNSANLGYQRNFEIAMAQCTGTWIAPCDQDDIWLPHKLSVLAQELRDGKTLLAYCDSELVNEAGVSMRQRISDHMHRFSTDDPAGFFLANNVTGHAMLFARSLLDQARPFPPDFFYDWWLAYIAASQGRIGYVHQCLVRYRQHASTVTDLTGQRPAAAERTRGFRSRELADTRERLVRFASVAGKGQSLATELLNLWQARESQFVSWRLARFMLKHRQRLYAFQMASPGKKIRQALGYAWGVRLKRLFEPHRYA